MSDKLYTPRGAAQQSTQVQLGPVDLLEVAVSLQEEVPYQHANGDNEYNEAADTEYGCCHADQNPEQDPQNGYGCDDNDYR